MSKDWRQFLNRLRKAGWEVVPARSGHYRAYPPDGGPFVSLPGTPSCPRTIQNVTPRLKRAGWTG